MGGVTVGLVTVLGCLLVVAIVVVAVVAVRSAARERARQTTRDTVRDPFRAVDDDAAALRGDPRTLRPGDIVEIRHTSYAVRGTLRFTEGSWSWAEHLLDDAQGAKVWMSVEEDPDLEMVLWTELRGATVTPGAARLDLDGREYSQDETGRANYTATGSTGLNPTGTVRYHDYVAADGARLSFEAYGDSDRWEVGTGELLHSAEVLIYPQAPDGAAGTTTGGAG